MYKTERQMTRNARKLADEEIYTNVDLRGQDYNPLHGYRFEYPQTWMSNPSQKKVIGLRRLKIIPTSHVFNFYFQTNDENLTKTYEKLISLEITSNNSLEEIMHEMSRQISETNNELLELFDFRYDYDYKTGDLTMKLIKMDRTDTELAFNFVDVYDSNYNFREFLMFLNQDPTHENIDELKNKTTSKTFHNVWNRENLYFHASFSTTNHRFIGLNNDAWDAPSIFYPCCDNSNDFYIWFTTDMTHYILPKYCDFIVQLSFIVNIDNYYD